MAELKYIGNGKQIGNIPARDLSAEEVAQYGGELRLLKFGIYEKIVEKKKSVKENLEVPDGSRK